ncbi:MAG: hypothetical protein DMG97_29305 [Acidobacteria bacterium]|nr:MAG: hypothetical protein DMG97_29305 [Acidobacteriota bacterium]
MSEIRSKKSEDKSAVEMNAFYLEYTSPDAILKYTRVTARAGINSLLDRDYKNVYLQALDIQPVV